MEEKGGLHSTDFHFCHFAPFVAVYPAHWFYGEEGEGV